VGLDHEGIMGKQMLSSIGVNQSINENFNNSQQSIVNMQVRGTPGSLPQALTPTWAFPSQREWSRPEHDMTEGIETLTYIMSPEATLNKGLS